MLPGPGVQMAWKVPNKGKGVGVKLEIFLHQMTSFLQGIILSTNVFVHNLILFK
jgi:hypothetical protein